MSLYQLVGPKGLRAGELVDMGTPNERWGRIMSVVKADYQLPNPCVVMGTRKFIQQPVDLYLIRGGYAEPAHPVHCVWSFSS